MSWPAWAAARVELAEPDPSWPARGRALAADLDELLSPWLVTAVEHVGSTAVSGLLAKPVLDLMAAVPDFDALLPDGLAPQWCSTVGAPARHGAGRAAVDPAADLS